MTTAFDEFIATIARLRDPDGCPWDREQDHRSLARYLLEESYEVLEAIHEGKAPKLKEELGDLLLQIVLNAQVAKDNGDFDIQDVAAGINAKMIKRHPHVFGDKTVSDSKDVVIAWEKLKEDEQKSEDANRSVVDMVPKLLPALLKALKVSEKAVQQGFEWEDQEQLWDQLLSELDELKVELSKSKDNDKANRRDIELEIGDVLFTVVNIARWQKINPEEALLLSIDKFRQRYRKMEELSQAPLNQLNKNELGQLWCKAKAAFAQTDAG